jgi:hypothetical protein
MHEVLVKELFPAEKKFLENKGKFEAEFAALYTKDKKKALDKLTAYVAAAFEKVEGITKKLLAKNPV